MTADAAFWNNTAENYAKKPVGDPAAFERKIAITLERIWPDAHVLDIGCGTGSLALRLAPHAAHVHGLDISSEMMRFAHEKARAAGVENVTFHTNPFDDTFTAIEDASLDVVCAYSILHLLNDRDAALERIFQLLKPGGSFVSSTVCLGNTWVPFRPVLALMRMFGKAPSVQIFDRATLEDDMRRAGFVDVKGPDVGAAKTTAFLVATKPG